MAACVLWAKISGTTVSDTEIAAAMDRASALFREGKYKEALAGFWAIEVPECFPNRRAQKWHNIGLIELKRGNPGQAKSALQQAISYDPKDLDAYYLLARIACDAQRHAEAAKYVEQAQTVALNGGPLPEQWRGLVTELESLGNSR